MKIQLIFFQPYSVFSSHLLIFAANLATSMFFKEPQILIGSGFQLIFLFFFSNAYAQPDGPHKEEKRALMPRKLFLGTF